MKITLLMHSVRLPSFLFLQRGEKMQLKQQQNNKILQKASQGETWTDPPQTIHLNLINLYINVQVVECERGVVGVLTTTYSQV